MASEKISTRSQLNSLRASPDPSATETFYMETTHDLAAAQDTKHSQGPAKDRGRPQSGASRAHVGEASLCPFLDMIEPSHISASLTCSMGRHPTEIGFRMCGMSWGLTRSRWGRNTGPA